MCSLCTHHCYISPLQYLFVTPQTRNTKNTATSHQTRNTNTHTPQILKVMHSRWLAPPQTHTLIRVSRKTHRGTHAFTHDLACIAARVPQPPKPLSQGWFAAPRRRAASPRLARRRIRLASPTARRRRLVPHGAALPALAEPRGTAGRPHRPIDLRRRGGALSAVPRRTRARACMSRELAGLCKATARLSLECVRGVLRLAGLDAPRRTPRQPSRHRHPLCAILASITRTLSGCAVERARHCQSACA